ncbi:MAG TPA: MBL fold metallo-hydrolase [Planctomycetes bacterium]|nr:MBL fold metallo-hydrolase [Planctomycetota bacterium]
MIGTLRITVLSENTAGKAGVLGEHGLAFWIEADGHLLLFDTGQGKVLEHNARELDVPLDRTELVVISHGHFDHTGGLAAVLNRNPQVPVCLHRAALNEKFARQKRPPHREIGIPRPCREALQQHAGPLLWASQPLELVPGVHVTGEIPRRNAFEDTGGAFFRDADCQQPDPLTDDQALFIETAAGVLVVLGCAHAGVVNTLDYVAELANGRPIVAVFGGMHLVRAKPPRLEATLAALERYGVRQVAPAHCTGMRAASYLWSRLGARCADCSVGSVFMA